MRATAKTPGKLAAAAGAASEAPASLVKSSALRIRMSERKPLSSVAKTARLNTMPLTIRGQGGKALDFAEGEAGKTATSSSSSTAAIPSNTGVTTGGHVKAFVRMKASQEGEPSIVDPELGLCHIKGNAITIVKDPAVYQQRMEALGFSTGKSSSTSTSSSSSSSSSSSTSLTSAASSAPLLASVTSKSYQEYSNLEGVFDGSASQEDVFDKVCKPMIDALTRGDNGAVLCYGQTGSGKTFTTMGEESNPGMLPRVIQTLLAMGFGIQMEVLEVYGQSVYCLFDWAHKKQELLKNTKGPKPKDHELEALRKTCVKTVKYDSGSSASNRSGQWDVKVMNATTVNINSVAEGRAALQLVFDARRTSATSMNAASSRSHVLVYLHVTMPSSSPGVPPKTALLVMADLAGSERQKDAKTGGKTLAEGAEINAGLSALSNVLIAKIALQKNPLSNAQIPWRDHILTVLLRSVLDGTRSHASFVITLDPRPEHCMTTSAALDFAGRAGQIVVKSATNGDLEIMQKRAVQQQAMKQQAALRAAEAAAAAAKAAAAEAAAQAASAAVIAATAASNASSFTFEGAAISDEVLAKVVASLRSSDKLVASLTAKALAIKQEAETAAAVASSSSAAAAAEPSDAFSFTLPVDLLRSPLPIAGGSGATSSSSSSSSSSSLRPYSPIIASMAQQVSSLTGMVAALQNERMLGDLAALGGNSHSNINGGDGDGEHVAAAAKKQPLAGNKRKRAAKGSQDDEADEEAEQEQEQQQEQEEEVATTKGGAKGKKAAASKKTGGAAASKRKRLSESENTEESAAVIVSTVAPPALPPSPRDSVGAAASSLSASTGEEVGARIITAIEQSVKPVVEQHEELIGRFKGLRAKALEIASAAVSAASASSSSSSSAASAAAAASAPSVAVSSLSSSMASLANEMSTVAAPSVTTANNHAILLLETFWRIIRNQQEQLKAYASGAIVVMSNNSNSNSSSSAMVFEAQPERLDTMQEEEGDEEAKEEEQEEAAARQHGADADGGEEGNAGSEMAVDGQEQGAETAGASAEVDSSSSSSTSGGLAVTSEVSAATGRRRRFLGLVNAVVAANKIGAAIAEKEAAIKAEGEKKLKAPYWSKHSSSSSSSSLSAAAEAAVHDEAGQGLLQAEQGSSASAAASLPVEEFEAAAPVSMAFPVPVEAAPLVTAFAPASRAAEAEAADAENIPPVAAVPAAKESKRAAERRQKLLALVQR